MDVGPAGREPGEVTEVEGFEMFAGEAAERLMVAGDTR